MKHEVVLLHTSVWVLTQILQYELCPRYSMQGNAMS